MAKVSIVIPYWNGAEKIKKYLPKVLEFAKKNGIEEIIASDDYSSDETVQLLKKDFSEVILVERKINKGFASNVNSGVSKVTGDFILLLNSDAAPENDCLKYALPHFENQKVFSVGCNVGGLWAIGRFENGFFWHDQAKEDHSDKTKFHQTLWASGGSGIFRKTIWDALGGLDELYNPFYVEDVDLGYRATKRGYINIWEPKSRVEHYKEKGVIESSFSRSRINKISERNMLIFIWKNITSENLLKEHKKALVKRLLLHPKYWQIFFAAAMKFPAIMEKRNIEKRYAKLSDEDIFNIFSEV